MSTAATALIWWVVPAMGLVGALGYVLWVSKFQGKYQQETQRSVGQFQRFQESLRDSQARDADAVLNPPIITALNSPSHVHTNTHPGSHSGSHSDAPGDAASGSSSD